MSHIFFFLYTILLSFIFAKVEIAIEGPHGWAGNLPTWKLPRSHWMSRIFFGNKPATGYHLWINLFIIFFAHSIYYFQSVTLSIELRLISFIILFWIIEDFLWFILNPSYGIRKFRKDKIWWHKDNWWLFAPRDYFIFLPIAIIIYYFSIV
jgi:hypothetical protein